MKKTILALLLLLSYIHQLKAQLITNSKTDQAFAVSKALIYVDSNDDALVQKAAQLLQEDIERVTGKKIAIVHSIADKEKKYIIIGTKDKSKVASLLLRAKKITVATIWEAYSIKTISEGLAIIGNDRRGTAYGVFELSKQLGVSPWYWWADVPIEKKEEIFIRTNGAVTDAPKVKYRGIFINDEAPALSNWSKEKFGGFNHKFYEKVFELIIRLKGNYLWPAMWGNAFYDDDSLNIQIADTYGIVIGTSHHEPLMRAHDEWRRYGKKQKWNYDSTKAGLQDFWRGGMQRAWNEKIVSVGMRGDGDEPMSRQTATELLERIVTDQRKIIEEVTGKPANETPQLWALYKEVQDYYDKGMRVPDDVTLLLCDDNWGNIRKLPRPDEKPRKGGYGIYYHFDYVGGPRNYKWLNTNPLPRIWEQMHLAYEHGVKNIWIVNVGDIKPMELPISFFLDYAWSPERISQNSIQTYTEQWVARQFNNFQSKDIAELLAKYAKYNSRRKPELLDANTYSMNHDEWLRVVTDYNTLLNKAEQLNKQLPESYRDAYFQLVLHPIKACANLNEMYYHVAMNRQAYQNKWKVANDYADKVKELYVNDSLITIQYHQLNNGKWNHMMSQKHIGYRIWQEPRVQKMPEVRYVPQDSIRPRSQFGETDEEVAPVPKEIKGNIFYEHENYGVSIEAIHFTKAITGNGITWQTLPDLGRTNGAVTTFPVTATEQKPGNQSSPHLEYEVYTYSKDSLKVHAYFSPSLNYFNKSEGLQYAISIDDEALQIISINKEDKNTGTGIWNKWAAENIIVKTSGHFIKTPGKHTVKYWFVNSGVVLQKIVIDFGNVKQTYLGPPETRITN